MKIYQLLTSIASFFAVNAKEDQQFNMIIPAGSPKTDPDQYADRECREMLKIGVKSKIYSEGCGEMGKDFHDIDLATLRDLSNSANSYWCADDYNCEITTSEVKPSKEKGVSNVLVCASTNEMASMAKSMILTKTMAKENDFPLNNRDSFRGIMMATVTPHAKMAYHVESGKIVFDAYHQYHIGNETLQSLNPGLIPVNIASHEIGHTVFKLDHPNDPKAQSIMNNRFLSKNSARELKTAEYDKSFLDKCVGKKNSGSSQHEL